MLFGKILRSRLRRPQRRRNGRRLQFEPLETRHLLATFLVSNLDDSGLGSLRQAVLDANVAVGADEISFQSGLSGTIPLTSGQIEITDALTITGPSAENLTIDAQQRSRIFEIARKSGLVTIDGVTLTRGKTVEQGGAIRSVSASSDTDDVLKIRNSVITGNTADRGGGGVSGFHIQMRNSTVSNNDSIFAAGGIQGGTIDIRNSNLLQNMGNDFYGSAVHSEHSLTIRNSSVSGNTGELNTVSSFGDVLVTGSTVANNTAQFNAGIYGASIRIHDSTITGNTASGGNLVYGRGKIFITESTISGNTAFAVSGDNDVTVSDSTISDNGGGVASSDKVIVKNSSIIGNAGLGIAADRDVTVTNSDISGNARQGIRATRGLELSDSTVSNNGDRGIRVSGTATVLRSSISGNLGAGIGAGKSVTATQTTIIGNDGYGISAYEVATVIDSTVAENSGSGVIGDEGVAITGSTVSNNRDGGVFSYQAVEITNSAISGNTSQHDGGGVFTSGDLTIIGSTISKNTAMDRGGGIYIFAVSNLTVINSTISGNSAQSGGGGIDANRARIVVSNSTITQNDSGISGAGGILADQAQSFSLHSSIVAGNFAGEICALSDPPRCSTIPADISRLDVIDVTNSLIGDNEGTNLAEAPLGAPDANGNLIGDTEGAGVIDPVLGPLQDNGGPTETHLLLAGSPAIDAGANPLNLDTDQRGLPRQYSAAVDMGAVELLPEIFIVNSRGDGSDANPGDGICDDGAGHCTLRAAIEEANALPNGVFPDEIHFDIPDDGTHTIPADRPQTIQVLSALPAITDAVVINGPILDGIVGASIGGGLGLFIQRIPSPGIEIDGSLAGQGANGITIAKNGSGSTVRGLAILGFSGDGIYLSRSSNVVIEGNYIGQSADGRTFSGNANGIRILNGSDNTIGGQSDEQRNVIVANDRGVLMVGRNATGNLVTNNTIGTTPFGALNVGNVTSGVEIAGAVENVVDGNVISGNKIGVYIRTNKAMHNLIQRNRIGTNAAGSSAIPNATGVQIDDASHNLIGGPDTREIDGPDAGNHISGNSKDGILIRNGSENRIQGNRIGTIDGSFFAVLGPGLPNGSDGIDIRGGHSNLVGGLQEGEGNTVSGNGKFGINIASSNNRVEGNRVGTDFTGRGSVGNGLGGIQLSRKASGNTIGGTAPGAGNQVSGNDGPGIRIFGDENLVQGNLVGTNADGTAPPIPSRGSGGGVIVITPLGPQGDGNGGEGIRVVGSDNTIGGSEAGAANVVAFNAGPGIWVSKGTGNAISNNSTFENRGLGIDLGRSGATTNDGPLDADAGANNLQNTPEILRTLSTATHLQIIFYVPSQAPHSTYPIRAEFFVADDDGQEGRTFLASAEVTLPTPTVISIPLSDIPLGAQIVATATDGGGNTSEFSAPFAAQQSAASIATEQAADLVFQNFGE